MINLSQHYETIINAINYKAEHLTDTINTLVNNDAADTIVSNLKDEQDTLYALADQLMQHQDEGYTNLALLTDDENAKAFIWTD